MNRSVGKKLVLLLFALLYFSTNQPYTYAQLGMDPSWWSSLVMAIEQNEVFGKDFIFNYGPLGYLNTLLLPKGVSPFVLFLFQLFILTNFLAILHFSMEKAGKRWWVAALVAITILLPWGFIADSTFTLFYFLIFWLLFVFKTRSTLPLLLCIILAVLVFFIKVNLSLIAYFVLLGSLVYFGFSKIITWRTSAIVAIILGLATLAMSSILKVDTLAYLKASLEIIDAYQDAMAVKLVDGWELWTMLSFFIVILVVVIYLILRNLAFFVPNIYLYLLVALACFLGFKQAFTATGHYNIFGFYLLLPPLMVLFYLFMEHSNSPKSKFKSLLGKTVIGVLCIQLLATQFIRVSYTAYDFKSYALFALPDEVANEVRNSDQWYKVLKLPLYRNPIKYFKALMTYDYELNFADEQINNQRLLPKEVLAKIGNSGFDIMPWETSYAFFNQLNYQHRPVMQSYQANNEWLARQNEEKYYKESAPTYVLASLGDFRSQNPYWLDQGVYLALWRNYTLKDTVVVEADTSFLFQKTKNLPLPSYQLLGQDKAELKQQVAVPSSEVPLFLKAKVEYNVLGKLARLFFQPPYLMVSVSYENGETESFRIPPPILKGGVLVNKKVTSQDEFILYNTQKGADNVNVVSLKFWSKGDWGFNNDFEFSFEKLK